MISQGQKLEISTKFNQGDTVYAVFNGFVFSVDDCVLLGVEAKNIVFQATIKQILGGFADGRVYNLGYVVESESIEESLRFYAISDVYKEDNLFATLEEAKTFAQSLNGKQETASNTFPPIN